MVDASVLAEIVDGLERLLGRAPDDHVDDGEAYRSALNQSLAALNLTKAYIADQTRGRPPDGQREHQLSMAWARAAGRLEGVDPALAEKCRLEDEDWANPRSWDTDELERTRDGIDRVAVEIRTRLAS